MSQAVLWRGLQEGRRIPASQTPKAGPDYAAFRVSKQLGCNKSAQHLLGLLALYLCCPRHLDRNMGTERSHVPYLTASEPCPQAPVPERKSLPVACPCSLLLGAHPFEQQAALMNGFPIPQQVGKLSPLVQRGKNVARGQCWQGGVLPGTWAPSCEPSRITL